MADAWITNFDITSVTFLGLIFYLNDFRSFFVAFCRKKLKTAFLQIFGFLGRNFGHLIQIEMKIVDVFAHQRQKMKSFATFRRFGLNLVAVNASAEGASENFRAFYRGTAYMTLSVLNSRGCIRPPSPFTKSNIYAREYILKPLVWLMPSPCTLIIFIQSKSVRDSLMPNVSSVNVIYRHPLFQQPCDVSTSSHLMYT